MSPVNPQLAEFIRFCVKRCGTEWPSIYHEMARVSGERLFKGMDYTELKSFGLSLAASNLDTLKCQVNQVADLYQEHSVSPMPSCRETVRFPRPDI
jgi:hypothetical protein